MRFPWAMPWFALRNLLRQPRRTAMAVSAVAFGIVALMLASGFIEWIYHDLRESTIRAHLGHLQVVRPGYHELGRSDPFKYLLPADSPNLRKFAPRRASRSSLRGFIFRVSRVTATRRYRSSGKRSVRISNRR